jgi:hypothetical protein
MYRNSAGLIWYRLAYLMASSGCKDDSVDSAGIDAPEPISALAQTSVK